MQGENIFAFCPASSSDWPLCADGTGYTLELINPELDNSVAENWDCINEFGSPNAHNNENLSVVLSTDFNQVKIYPNPVNDILYISGQSQKYDIEIYTLTGQRLYRYFNVSTIDMSLYDDGVYLIKIFDKSSISTKRVIKIN